MDPCELAMFITASAVVIARNISDDELDVLALAFTQLGDTLATISAQRQILEKNGTDGQVAAALLVT
ncbi:MAG TPA: hypothetical protein PKA19_09890 [Bacillota bacterium]|nr:hypothetical protein [Bacillota bacterium]